MRIIVAALLVLLIGAPALAEDTAAIHFQPSDADMAPHYVKPVKQPKPKRSHVFRAVRAASIASYLTGCAAQGASRNYQAYQANHAMRNYTVNGQSVTVQRNW